MNREEELVIRVADFLELAIARDERATRSGVWTDRDCMVHALAILSGGDRAREATIHAPVQIMLPRLELQRDSWPTTQALFVRRDGLLTTKVRVTKSVFEQASLNIPSMVQVTIEEDA